MVGRICAVCDGSFKTKEIDMKWRKLNPDFKRKVVLEAMRGDETVRSIAARHGVNPN